MADDPTPRPSRVIARREALVLLGAAGLTAVAAACSGDSGSSASGNGGRRGSGSSATSSPTTSSSIPSTAPNATTVSCVLAPETTEGPFYIDGQARSDITEGKPGTPLRLALTIATVSGSTCRPLPGAAVDIWHSDASGSYSGFGNAASNSTFLRGVQTSDANGTVTFTTIYPGWYQGRAVHIHVKVYAGGSEVHTGQLFFDDAVSTAVFAAAPYTSRSGQFVRNSQDSIYSNSGGAQSLVPVTREGTGYTGAMTLGVTV